MKAIVVLGMHRSGTSLVANMLDKLGVDMGEEMLGANLWNEWGLWEDSDFYKVNIGILQTAGGTWARPPERGAIVAASIYVKEVLLNLVGYRQGRELPLWGWKDPRTCLTVQAYHPMLINPHYIQVVRKKGDVVRSLMKRAGEGAELVREMVANGKLVPGAADEMKRATWGKDRWKALVDRYLDDVKTFLGRVDAPRIRVRYEDLMNTRKSKREVERIAAFVGSDEVDAALEAIRYKEK